jgi:hypothetical protein
MLHRSHLLFVMFDISDLRCGSFCSLDNSVFLRDLLQKIGDAFVWDRLLLLAIRPPGGEGA